MGATGRCHSAQIYLRAWPYLVVNFCATYIFGFLDFVPTPLTNLYITRPFKPVSVRRKHHKEESFD
jgi:hypothetical protein